MKAEKLILDFLIKKAENLKVDKKKLFTSYASLFLVSAVLVTHYSPTKKSDSFLNCHLKSYKNAFTSLFK